MHDKNNSNSVLKALRKITINLLVLISFGLLLWSIVKAFSHQWTPFIGFSIVVALLVSFILSCTLFNKIRFRRPSMKLTVLSLVGLLVIAAFSGLEPLNTYKTNVFGKMAAFLPSENKTLNIPSTPYFADIIGKVTIISNSVMKDGKTLPSPSDGGQFWVVQIQVRNKGYEKPIKFNESWSVSMNSSLFGNENIGGVMPWIGGSNITVSQGQEGEVTLLLYTHPGMRKSDTGGIFFDVVPNVSSCRLRFIGQNSSGSQIDSFGIMSFSGSKVGVYNWDTKTVVDNSFKTPTFVNGSVTDIPFGTYVANTMLGDASLTLNRDGTYATTGGIEGKDVGTYFVGASSITFRSANPSLGSYTQVYSYSNQFNCLYLGPSQSVMIPYYRR